VGRGREKEALKTLEGFGALAETLEDKAPDVLVVLSPHQPYAPGVLFVCGERFEGNLESFGAPQVQLQADGATEETEEILGILRDVPVHRVDRETATLDHASLVPLWFLSRRWRSMPRLVVANPLGWSSPRPWPWVGNFGAYPGVDPGPWWPAAIYPIV